MTLSGPPLLQDFLPPRHSHNCLSSHNEASEPLLLELSLAVRWFVRNGRPVKNLQDSVEEQVNIDIEANQVRPNSSSFVDAPEWTRYGTQRNRYFDEMPTTE
jgi:hypothetical protein